MRQQVIYSALIMAVAPVATMMATGTYQKVNTPQVATTEGVTLLKTTSLTVGGTTSMVQDIKWFAIELTGQTELKGTLKIKWANYTVTVANIDVAAGTYTYDIPQPGEINNESIEVVFEGTGTVTDVKLLINASYKDDFKAKFAELLQKAKDYITRQNTYGDVTDANNRDLTLVRDICDGKINEFTLENFERFDLYNGLTELTNFLSTTVKKIEVDHAKALLDKASEPLEQYKQYLDDNPKLKEENPDLYQAIKDALDENKGKITDFEEYAKGDENVFADDNLDKVKNATDKLLGLNAYVDYQIKLDKVNNGIKHYEKLLNEYKQSVGSDDGALLGIDQENNFRTKPKRLAGIKAAYEMFKTAAADAYDEQTGTFTAPTDKKPTDGNNYATIEKLLGTSDKVTSNSKGIGVLENIGYLQYCAQQYQKRFEDVLTAIDGAETTYNTALHNIETAVLAEEAEDKKCDGAYTKWLNQKKDELFQAVAVGDELKADENIKKEYLRSFTKSTLVPGFETLEAWVKEVKKNGWDISYTTLHSGSGWGAKAPDFNNEDTYVPAQLWEYYVDQLEKKIKDLEKELTDAIDDIHDKYTKEINNVTGTDVVDMQVQATLDEAKSLLDQGAAAVYADEIKEIQEGIDELVDVVNEKNSTIDTWKLYQIPLGTLALGDPYDIVIRKTDGNSTEYVTDMAGNVSAEDKAAGYIEVYLEPLEEGYEYDIVINTNPAAYTTVSVTDAAIMNPGWQKKYDQRYNELLAQAKAIKDNAANANNEYDAYQALLATADDLAQRLKVAGSAIDNLTKDMAAPAYKGSEFFGYKDIDNLETPDDEAAENTHWAERVTNYVRLLREAAEKAYGDGKSTGAQEMKDGHPTWKTVVSTDTKDGWSVPGDAKVENGKLTLPTGGNSQFEVGAITEKEVRVHVNIDGLTSGKLWCYLLSDGSNNMFNGGEGVVCDKSYGQDNGEVVFTLTNVPAQNNAKLQFYTDGHRQYSVSDIYITQGAVADVTNLVIPFNTEKGADFDLTITQDDQTNPTIDWSASGLTMTNPQGGHVVSKAFKLNAGTYKLSYELSEAAADVYQNLFRIIDATTKPENIDNPVTIVGSGAGKYDNKKMTNAQPGAIEGYIEGFNNNTITIEFTLDKNVPVMFDWWCTNHAFTLQNISLEELTPEYDDVSGYVSQLEKGGNTTNAYAATESYITYREAYDKEVLALNNNKAGEEGLYQLVKDLEIYNIPTDALGGKTFKQVIDGLQKALDDGPKATIATISKNDPIADGNWDEDHWNALLALSYTNVVFDDGKGAKTIAQYKDLIELAKAQYEFDSFENSVAQLRDQIYGTDGHLTAKGDGLVDEALADFEAEKQASFGIVNSAEWNTLVAQYQTELAAKNPTWTAGQVLKKAEDNATAYLKKHKFGTEANYTAIEALWNDLKAAIQNTALNDGKKKTDDDSKGAWYLWNEYTKVKVSNDDLAAIQDNTDKLRQLNDDLQKLKDILDASMQKQPTDGSAAIEKVNDIVLSETTNTEKLAEYTRNAANIAAAYDKMVPLYQAVRDHLNDDWDKADDVTAAENATKVIASDDDVYGTPEGRHVFSNRLISFEGAGTGIDGKGAPVSVDAFAGTKIKVAKIDADGNKVLDDQGNQVFVETDVTSLDKIGDIIAKYNYNLVDWVKAYDDDEFNSVMAQLDAYGVFDQTNPLLNDRLVQKTLIDAANNKAAYDELLAIKQQLTTRIDTYLNDLQDPATYPAETDEAKALIDIITTYYKPVPTDMTPLVEQAYINGEAYSQGSLLSNRKPDVAAYQKPAGETWDDTYGFSTEAKDQVLYYVMKDSLDHLDNLMANFNDKYNSYVTAKNQAVFDDKIKAAYDEIYQLYDKRVLALRDNFSDLKREELQDAYTAAFKTLTEELYKTPNALKKALVDAQANMTTANGKNEDYDPAADLAIFDGIKSGDVVEPFKTFIKDMKDAANVVNNLYKDYEESTGKITTTWNAIKGFYATAKTPAPYETFENIYLADGTKFVDADTKYDYLYESRNDVRDAKALNTKIQDAKWLDADLKNCADYKDFDALVSGNAGNKTMPAIDSHLKAKLNEAAQIDLNNRIIIAQKEEVTPNAQSFMGQLIKVKDAEGKEHTIGVAETYTDLEGNEQTIDLTKKYYTDDELNGHGQPNGFGFADAKGRYYNYKNALGEEAYNELVTKFESLVAGTIGAAQEYNKKFAANGEYFNAIDDQPNVLLPNENYKQEELDEYIVGFNSTSYQFVRDLVGKYTETTAFDDLFAPYVAKYQAFIDNVDYNDMMEAFYNDADGGLWKQAYDGITSLYVGNDFVGKLNDLKKDWEDETANPTKDPAQAKQFIEDLTQELKNTENAARVAEYTEMKDELNKLKAEYNQMMAEQGDIYDQAVLDIAAAKVLDPAADVSELEAKRDAAEKRREELQQKFDSANKQLNIDDNIADLDGYEAARQKDQPVDYDKYVETEHNVALIKAEIAVEAGTITPEQIVAKGTALTDAIDALLATKSQYLPGNPLLLEFQNPESQYFDDFGLYEYYLNKDVAAVKELIDSYKVKLTKLQESINIAKTKTGDVTYVLLYEEKIKTQLAQFDEGGQLDLAQLDNLLNKADYTNGYRKANQERLDRAASHVVAYESLKGEIKAVSDLIPAAEEKIAGLGFTKEDGQGNTVIDKGDFSTQLKRLAILEMRLKTLYLQGDAAMLDENTTLNNDMFGGTYILERFMNGFNVEAEGDIVEKYSLDTDDANLGTYTKDGQVELPAAFGLTAIKNQINQIVQGYVDKLALQKYNEAYTAFNDLAAEVNALVMRKADKDALLIKLYNVNKDVKDETTYELDGNGNMIVKELDTSFQKQLFDLEKLKSTRDIKTIAQYVEDVNAYIASLKVDFTAEVEDNIAGDVDGNKDVNIYDLTYILKLVNNPSFYEEQKTAEPEKVEKSDLNRDGHIDVVDLGIFIDIMSGDTGYLYEQGVLKARAAKTGDRIAAEVVSTNGNSQRIAIALDNVSEFTAFQMDVTMPKGMHIVNVELTDRASEQTLYSNDWNGKTRIVAFTSSKAAISGSEGALLYIDVESDADYKGGNVKYDDILFLTTQSRGVRLQMNGETTGIMSRLANAADAAKQTIYNMGGRVMNGLKKGVNILRGENGETEKVIRK